MTPTRRKLILKSLITSKLFITLLVSSSAVYSARPDFNKLNRKAADMFNLLDRVYAAYPRLRHKTGRLEVFKNSWERQSTEFKNARGKDRSLAHDDLIKTYKSLSSFTEDTCLTLQRYSNDIMVDFNERLKAKRNAEIAVEKYHNSIKVSKIEFHRASIALRHRNFRYSTHLYDRGIRIIKKTYKKLNWALPPAYQSP